MTKINVFDRTLKIIARNYADLLMELTLRSGQTCSQWQ